MQPPITYHRSCRNRVPLQPEGDEGRRHQYDARYEDGGEVEGPVAREYQVHLQAAVVSCVRTSSHACTRNAAQTKTTHAHRDTDHTDTVPFAITVRVRVVCGIRLVVEVCLQKDNSHYQHFTSRLIR